MAVQLQTYGTPEEFANFIRRVYADAETNMIARVAKRLVRGIDSAGWAEAKLAETQTLAREIGAAVRPLRELPGRIQEASEKAYDEGVQAAIGDLKAANLLAPGFSPTTAAGSGVKALAGAVTGTLEQAHLQILRSALDAYRNVVAEASAQVLTGTQTRREVAQVVLNRFADRGVRPFRDSAGRTWDMASYAEMAVRSTTGQAAVQGHLETLSAGGDDLVICSASTESCPLCNEWEGKVLSISGRSTEYPSVQDAVAAGLLHPNCVVGNTLVTGPRIVMSFSRWFEGNVIIIRTASGNELTVTPNHPILTPEGWVAARALHKGDKVLRHLLRDGVMSSVYPDDVDVPTRIDDVAGSLGHSCGVSPRRMPVAAEDFHGDGGKSNVCVVRTDGLLLNRLESSIAQPLSDDVLCGSCVGQSALLAIGPLAQLVERGSSSSAGAVRRCSESAAFACGHSRNTSRSGFRAADCSSVLLKPTRHAGLIQVQSPSNVVLALAAVVAADYLANIGWLSLFFGCQLSGLRPSSDDSSSSQVLPDKGGRDIHVGSDLIHGLPSEIVTDTVVRIETSDFAGHVYNLQTARGWYACNSIITHNCTHALDPFVPGLTRRREVEPLSERRRGYQERQHQRYNERMIRHWKLREAAAITDSQKALAAAKVAAWQQRQRDFIADTGRRRDYTREQIKGAR